MMKKILFTLSILFLATGSLMAQEFTNWELQKFVEELRAPGCGPRNESRNEEKGILNINSVNEESYKAFNAIIEKYGIYFAEEIFGMELMFNTWESGYQTIMFQGDTYGLLITDNTLSQHLSVTIVKGSIAKLCFETEESAIVEETPEEVVYFNLNFEETPELIDFPEAESIESLLPTDIIVELFDHYMPMIQELEIKGENGKADSIRQTWEDEIALINYWIEQRIAPGEIKIPCTGNEFIVIPKNTRRGIYEWINSTDFCNTEGQEYNILTATQVAMLYTTKKKEPNIGWNLESYSDSIKTYFASEIPGNEPTYLYRRSITAEGYERMKNDLEQFFCLDGKNKSHRHKGFRTIERIDTDGYCFLHLYDGCTTILIYDSPTVNHCQMDIIVGGIETFNDAINDISINGIRGIAKKENIIIRNGGIELAEDEVEINGVAYDSGVHFTTEYMENLK
jgi:hypothetical protein